MKILFLDFDGVLNHEEFYSKRLITPSLEEYPFSEIDPKSVEKLNYIINKTGAKVVVSSKWRLNRTVKELQNILNYFGFVGEIIDITPDLAMHDAIVRGNEIWEWIRLNSDDYFRFTSYVILDDDCDMLYYQKDNFIHVDKYVGITGNNVIKAIAILNGDRGIQILD
jgi:histidinol phosphatase-like enzyme